MRQPVNVMVDRFADWRDQNRPSINSLKVNVTERYLRRRLGLKKDDPLIYRGLELKAKCHTPTRGTGQC